MKRFRNICAIARQQKQFTFEVVNKSLCQLTDYQKVDYDLIAKILKEKASFVPKINHLSIQKTTDANINPAL